MQESINIELNGAMWCNDCTSPFSAIAFLDGAASMFLVHERMQIFIYGVRSLLALTRLLAPLSDCEPVVLTNRANLLARPYR